MIISASRRTDIPAFYSDWFFNRIKEGYVLVRNPMNAHQISKISLSADVIDCIVFWTKNPRPMINRLDELKDYNYYFQFTLNSYAKDIEPNVPSKDKEIIKSFRELSEKIGKDRVVWRYDPILINDNYSVDHHIKYFRKLAELLDGSFDHCIISFVDYYRKNATSFKENNISELQKDIVYVIAESFNKVSNELGFIIKTCAEKYDLSKYGIAHGKCIDDEMISHIAGSRLNVQKDKNQRAECSCVESVDIGLYNTCLHGCKYCYANYSNKSVIENHKKHDPAAPILCSSISEKDIITEKSIKSLFDPQLRFDDI